MILPLCRAWYDRPGIGFPNERRGRSRKKAKSILNRTLLLALILLCVLILSTIFQNQIVIKDLQAGDQTEEGGAISRDLGTETQNQETTQTSTQLVRVSQVRRK